MNRIISAGVAVLFAAGAAEAAVISWGSAQNIASINDVSTSGTMVYAYSFGGHTTSFVVNGETFTGIGSQNGNSDVAFASDASRDNDTAFTSTTAPFTDLASEYQGILGGGAYARQLAAATVTMNGLTEGTQYQVQYWVSDPRGEDYVYDRSVELDGAVTLDYNVNNAEGSAGQFVIGTFTADADSQAITLNGLGAEASAQINAIQLRVIPEPATLGLVMAYGGGLLFIRRRLAM